MARTTRLSCGPVQTCNREPPPVTCEHPARAAHSHYDNKQLRQRDGLSQQSRAQGAQTFSLARQRCARCSVGQARPAHLNDSRHTHASVGAYPYLATGGLSGTSSLLSSVSVAAMRMAGRSAQRCCVDVLTRQYMCACARNDACRGGAVANGGQGLQTLVSAATLAAPFSSIHHRRVSFTGRLSLHEGAHVQGGSWGHVCIVHTACVRNQPRLDFCHVSVQYARAEPWADCSCASAGPLQYGVITHCTHA